MDVANRSIFISWGSSVLAFDPLWYTKTHSLHGNTEYRNNT